MSVVPLYFTNIHAGKGMFPVKTNGWNLSFLNFKKKKDVGQNSI